MAKWLRIPGWKVFLRLIQQHRLQETRNFVQLPLQWRHNGRDGVSNHQPHDCFLNRLFIHSQRKHQSSASLAFVRGIHRRPVNSPHKWPVTWKMFPFDDVIMTSKCHKQGITNMTWSSGFGVVSLMLITQIPSQEGHPISGRLTDWFATFPPMKSGLWSMVLGCT